MSKKLGLALGSGGARGVVHIGFLQALDEAGIKPDFVTGCSMGSVVGGAYCSGLTPAEIRDIVLNLKIWDLLDVSALPITRLSLLKSRKMADLLLSNIGDKKLEDFKIPFKCVATDLLSGRLHVFEKGDSIKAIQASSSIPGVFKPVEYEGKLLVDGGCLCRVPFKLVKDMGADVVVGVDALKASSDPVEKIGNIVSMLLRVFDIMDSHASKLALELNPEACDLFLEPPLTGMSAYMVKDLDKAYAEGYALGKDNVDKIKQLLKD